MTTTDNNAICFHNNGTLERRAFTMMGLSAKADEKAIGFFGTGFKYGIATLLRHGASIRIVAQDGYGEYVTYDFSSAPGKFRGKEHNFVYCSISNDVGEYEEDEFELPFTTHLGANWKLWQAYRELYTNAKDEGGGVVLIDVDEVYKRNGVNVFVTNCPDFVEVYHNHNKYFLNAETLVEGYRMRAVEKQHNSDNVVYYKTMYTGTKLDKESYLTYDYIKTVELTEDRTLGDTWYLRTHIGELWINNMSYDMLVEHLPKIANDRYYEYGIDASYHEGSEDFHRACKYLNEMHLPMPMWARDVYSRKLPFDQQVEPYKPTRHQRMQLQRAIAVLAHHRHMIDMNNVVLCNSLPNDVLGYYKQGTIYIAKEAFTRGFEKLLGTLYEEHIHMVNNCIDMSREMQNILVDDCASLMLQIYEMEETPL